ncbi:MAG TPA: SGNH/GDSL hydrolase family protein [Kofleriaceae bacterium]|jgi:hypothetical protein
MRRTAIALVLLGACGSSESTKPTTKPPATEVVVAEPPRTGPAFDATRIEIVGASVSAGFGGLSFGDAFKEAVKPASTVDSVASSLLFRDPVGSSTKQIDRAIEHHATAVIAIDYLFWDLYGSTDPAWRDQALVSGLANLERARAAGALIVVGDVPHVVTAAEWMLPRSQVPDAAVLATYNAQIAEWAARDHVLFVPFASWAAPLAANETIEIAPGERVEAKTLMASDGLHSNPLGTWYLLDKLDHFIEEKLPGTPRDALVFVRPR